VVALVLLVSTACGGGGAAPTPAPSVQNGQIVIDGQSRAYRVFVPPTLDQTRPAPLVLVLHGGGNSVDDTVKATLFDRQAADGDFIVAYPEGTRRDWNAGTCCGSAPSRKVDDVGFLTRVLDQVEADHKIDPARVFVAGVSNGAMMAYRFACERADRVTGVGSVAGAVTVDGCQPSRPVSVLELHGTADPLVPYNGGKPDVPDGSAAAAFAGGPYTSTPAMIERWAEVDGCPAASPPTTAGPLTTESWAGCRNGSAVTLVSVQGGGHVWFGPALGPADGAVDATAAIWRFFSGLHPSG
jgi:polyhydroxybutyrate depolymerase